MIIEGILTTQADDGSMHVAPIGPHVDQAQSTWVLKPFQTSKTFANLRRTNRGIFHVVDDGLLVVQAVLGLCNAPHQPPSAQHYSPYGWVLEHACRAVALQVNHWDVSDPRAIAQCTVEQHFAGREFWGWNRAAHSLLELSVLFSRKHMIAESVLDEEFEKHRTIILKTAGDREIEALRLLDAARRSIPKEPIDSHRAPPSPSQS